jgi:hypothetical protein
MKMRASIAKLGMETRSFTAREFADKIAEGGAHRGSRHTESGIKIDRHAAFQ